MRVMVTGGAGYIGSVVTEALCDRGDSVVVYDSLVTGHRAAVDERAQFVQGDIRDPILRDVLRDAGIEAVVHMAAISLVGDSVLMPDRYFQNNVVGGLALLDAARMSGVKTIVFSSTAAVYGAPERQPIDEATPTSPGNPYGATKLAIEHALVGYASAFGLSSVRLRYFNAAGASLRFGEDHRPESHLIPRLLRVACGEEPEAVVYGTDWPTPDGTAIRDYVHVVDLADAHLRALDASILTSGVSVCYNLGCGGCGYSVGQVLESVIRTTGVDIPVRALPRRAGDPAVLVASSDAIRSALGWTPKHQNLDQIVSDAWTWKQRLPRGYAS
jgi:UDP-glucose 4-epimerase